MGRVFSPTANIYIPVHFKQVLTGGAPGGGGLSWSDFHDVSERELARQKGQEMEPTNRVRSQPGFGTGRY